MAVVIIVILTLGGILSSAVGAIYFGFGWPMLIASFYAGAALTSLLLAGLYFLRRFGTRETGPQAATVDPLEIRETVQG